MFVNDFGIELGKNCKMLMNHNWIISFSVSESYETCCSCSGEIRQKQPSRKQNSVFYIGGSSGQFVFKSHFQFKEFQHISYFQQQLRQSVAAEIFVQLALKSTVNKCKIV